MVEANILEFLRRKECASLALKPDNRGFKPIHYALRRLRPAAIDVLLALGADIMEPDPEGRTALHHIAGQCLTLRLESKERMLGMPQRRPDGFVDECLRLWRLYLDSGGSIDAPDPEGNPPLFYYLSHHEHQIRIPRGEPRDPRLDEPDPWGLPPPRSKTRVPLPLEPPDYPLRTCHAKHLDLFFADADLAARNAAGASALHIVATPLKVATDMPAGHAAALFKLLVFDKGLDPLWEDDEGRTSLDLAAAFKNQFVESEILELFEQRK